MKLTFRFMKRWTIDEFLSILALPTHNAVCVRGNTAEQELKGAHRTNVVYRVVIRRAYPMGPTIETEKSFAKQTLTFTLLYNWQ